MKMEMKLRGIESFTPVSSDLSDEVHLTYDGYKKMANKLTPVIEKLIQ